MSYSRRSRYSRSPSYRRYSSSVSRSKYLSRSRSRSCDSSDAENPGNNLYVTGLSARVKERDVEKHFSTEGTVEDVHLVVDPSTRESRGFCFVTMSSVEEADRCIKYLNQSVLEDRVITVEKQGSCVLQLFTKVPNNKSKHIKQTELLNQRARRRRGRTPTPGKYLGLRAVRAQRESRSYSPRSRSHSRHYSSESDRSRSRSHTPHYRREHRSYSSYYRGWQRSRSPDYNRRHRYSPYSPYYSRGRSYSRSSSPLSRSPVSRRDRSYSPDDRCYRRSRYRDYSPDHHRRDRSYSPDDTHYRRSRYNVYSPDGSYYRRSRHRDYSLDDRDLSYSPDGPYYRRSCYHGYSRDSRYYCRRSRYRSISRSISPHYRGSRVIRGSRRSYLCSVSPVRSKKSYSRSVSTGSYSHSSYSGRKQSSKSHSVGASSRFVSRSVTPKSSLSP